MRIVSRTHIEVETLDGQKFIVDADKVEIRSWSPNNTYLLIENVKYPLSEKEWKMVHNYSMESHEGYIEIETLREYDNPHFDTYLQYDVKSAYQSGENYYVTIQTSQNMITHYKISPYEYERIKGFFVEQKTLTPVHSPEHRKSTNAIMELEL